MDITKILEAKRLFQGRLDSLENDAKRAFYPIEGIQFSPFPITMYAFATIDYFSGFWAGWNDIKNRPKNDERFQTKRIADFLEKYLYYPQKESQIAINILRHKLMHTGEPRLMYEKSTNKNYDWNLCNITEKHFQFEKLQKTENFYILYVGIYNLIDDLKVGIFGSNGYFCELENNKDLQKNWKGFRKEIDEYKFKIE